VLDRGTVAQFDTPAKLLEDRNGIFAKMVEATGPSSAEHLRKMALGQISAIEDLAEQTNADLEEILASSPRPARKAKGANKEKGK